MPEVERLLPDASKEERIRKWREERKRIVAEERRERIAANQSGKGTLEAPGRENDDDAELAEITNRIDSIARSERRAWVFQFLVICVLPWCLSGYYLTQIATPLFEAKAVVAITAPTAANDTSKTGLLGASPAQNSLQDAFIADSFIRSHAMMDALETEVGLLSRFSSPVLDPLQRLHSIPILSQSKHGQFSRFVDSSVDIQTGLLTLTTHAPEKATALEISNLVLAEVERHVVNLNSDLVAQRLQLAEAAVDSAQSQVESAQTYLVRLQVLNGEANPEKRVEGIYAKVTALEAEILSLENEIRRSAAQGREGSFQLERTRDLRNSLVEEVTNQRNLLMAQSQAGTSLTETLMAHQLAEHGVKTAEQMLSTALAAKAETTQAVALSRSVFQIVVPPRTAELPTAPNIPRNLTTVIVMTLLIFALWRVVYVGRQTF